MKRVQSQPWLILAMITLLGITVGQAFAADAPWYVDNIAKTASDNIDATAAAAGDFLQIEVKVQPSATDVPWHNFKIVDVTGEEVGELSAAYKAKGVLVFEGSWDKVAGLYLEGMGHKQELFPNATIEDIPAAPVVAPAPVVRTVEPVVAPVVTPVVNRTVDRDVRVYDRDRDVHVYRDHDVDRTRRVIYHDDNDRDVHVYRDHDDDDVHVFGDDDDDVHIHDGDHDHYADGGHDHDGGHGHDGGHDDVADAGHGDGGHGHGGHGSGDGLGAGGGCSCGGVGCAECGGAGSPWDLDAFAKTAGHGDKLAMGTGAAHEFAPDSAFGDDTGKAPGKGPGKAAKAAPGEGTGEGAGPGEGPGTGPGEGAGPGPGEGTGPGPGEGEGPSPDEGEGPDPAEKTAAAGPGPGPGPGPGCDCADEPYGPEPPEMNPMNPNFNPGPGGPGAGSNMIGPNYKNMAPQIRPRVHNLAKNFLPDPPVIEGPDMYVFNPQIPYYNPQMPYYQPGFGYGYGGGGGYGYGGGGGFGYIPEGALDIVAPPKPEEGMVLYISCGGPNTEGKIYQVNEHGRVLGMVNLPYTATGIALHRDNGLVCVSPRDGGKIYRIDDGGKLSTVAENDENMVSPSDVAVGYNSDTMVVADNLTNSLYVTNTSGVKPVAPYKFKSNMYDKNEMSVAAARDKAVLLSTNDRPGVFRYSGNASTENTRPVLPKSGGVAASNGSLLWAATQDGDKIVVMEGDNPVRTFEIPQKNVYNDGLLSFGPRESVVVAAKDATGADPAPWLIQFCVDDEGQENIRNLFKWEQDTMVDFVVGPRMYWEKNDRKTVKSVY